MQMRLTENHPTVEKVNKVMDLMSELHLHFSTQAGQTFIIDDDLNLHHVELVDSEEGQEISELPTAFEFKLIYTKE